MHCKCIQNAFLKKEMHLKYVHEMHKEMHLKYVHEMHFKCTSKMHFAGARQSSLYRELLTGA